MKMSHTRTNRELQATTAALVQMLVDYTAAAAAAAAALS